ncbi:MAG: hypothetical protein ACP5I6_05220 [Caldisphaera sp.]|nr:MAG: hypothetical protein C0201_04160 [Caldisphaera sp.]PMP92092.1 MAG: hypothetical protein C0171_01580 [Caldisphaera sp.]
MIVYLAKEIQYFIVGLLIVIFSITSYLDIKYREVPIYIWYFSSKVGLILSFIAFYYYYPLNTLIIYYLISILSILGIVIAHFIGHLGGGDLWASVFLALSLPINPFGGFLPPILLILLYSAILELSTRIFLTSSECIKAKIYKRKCLTSAPIKGIDLINNDKYKWYFAEKSTKNISIDDPHETILLESKGDLNKIIWVQPGLPFLVFILISIPLALITGRLI